MQSRPARPEGGYVGGGGFGGGGSGGGFPPAAGASNFGPPAPARKTFDERRKKSFNAGEDGPKKRRFEKEDRSRGNEDWRTKTDDDD